MPGTLAIRLRSIVKHYVEVSRKGRIVIGDVVVEPEADISTNIEIKPLNPGGTFAAAAPDFSLASPEIRPGAADAALGRFVVRTAQATTARRRYP